METILNIILIAAVLVIGISLWQAWRIIQKGKNDEKLSEKDARKIDRWLSIFQVSTYGVVIILVVRFYLSYISG